MSAVNPAAPPLNDERVPTPWADAVLAGTTCLIVTLATVPVVMLGASFMARVVPMSWTSDLLVPFWMLELLVPFVVVGSLGVLQLPAVALVASVGVVAGRPGATWGAVAMAACVVVANGLGIAVVALLWDAEMWANQWP